jgi:hypothetical protein
MYRILKVYTPSYSYTKYKKLKNLYKSNIKEAHKRLLQFKTKILKSNNQYSKNNKNNFYVELIGFDNTVKYTFNTVNSSTFKSIFAKIDKMPLGYLRPGLTHNLSSKIYKKTKKNKSKQSGLSLYSDYKPEKTLKGTGFKNANIARQTLKLISNRDLTYQKQVVNTMYNRAKFHPNQTSDMKEAMNVYSKWLIKHSK